MRDEQMMALAKEANRIELLDLWESTADAFEEVRKALQELPFRVAGPALCRLDEIKDAVFEPLGEHMGHCILCEEPLFIRGEPDDDYEAAGDENCHRTCGDKWRAANPGQGHGYSNIEERE